MTGRVSSCAAVTVPRLLDAAMPTRFSAGFSMSATLRNVRAPVTTTSALTASVITASSAVTGPSVTTMERRSTLKLMRR